ncbi:MULTISPECIES: hemolysin III family protein [unclassified Bacillus (in: firmicutes)]|uniref:PAQR family membrane homeostasis protein TrhA n=1 Tax=unclassified Bacillus (in: firmicutes) TaxID=185979 RepID=UPI000BEF5B3C|nr:MULTISPECIES: hemolysin III family protein [unclassified Bacillus (in: firmicutes)]PEJ53308.1 hemolysin [Bacillus sp. AFS002410]PEL13062.1 hemolysin [Bacillus sp. AFS017336]
MENYMREPINSLTHLVGAVLSLFGLIAMIFKSTLSGGSILQTSAVVAFGISMILLYSASTTYHMAKASDKLIAFLRRMDHSMIFILIAGTYTPFCIISLNGKIGWIMFSIVTFIAFCGVLFKLIWFSCPRWLSTTLYIALGWVIIIASAPLTDAISIKGMFALILGGIFYTVGGVIYGVKPKFLSFKNWGFHEIFHIFIMLGTLSHFFCVYYFVI